MADETSPGDQPSYGELLELYLRGEAMKVELELLFAYFRKQPVEAARLMIMASRQRPASVVGQGELDPELSRKMLRRLLTDIRQTSERKEAVVVELPSQRRRVGWLVAAVLIGLLGTGTWWVLRSRQTSNPAVAVNAGDVAAPTRNRATITLGSGQQVDLDSAAAGALAAQDGAKIVKDANGHIVYKVDIDHPGALIYNTLNNPRGSQVVSLTLSDGTRVWLNAASSIRYPAAFLANERVVEITGEAYFEVAEDATKPFTVRKDNTVIEVLGTAFNVNSYGDEPVLAVTLLSGKVRVDVSGTDQVLDPGEQANVKDDRIALAATPNLEAVMAWKNGQFAFNSADLPTVMRQLGRWYDVDVRYDGAIPSRKFDGVIGKNLTLDQVLKLLTKARVHYTITGRQLTIRP